MRPISLAPVSFSHVRLVHKLTLQYWTINIQADWIVLSSVVKVTDGLYHQSSCIWLAHSDQLAVIREGFLPCKTIHEAGDIQVSEDMAHKKECIAQYFQPHMRCCPSPQVNINAKVRDSNASVNILNQKTTSLARTARIPYSLPSSIYLGSACCFHP